MGSAAHSGRPRDLGVQFDGEEPIGCQRCVDVAANRALPLTAHHTHIHTGTAGEMLATNA
jgi:hypothetical protein